MLKFCYLLLFGLITISAVSALNCSTSVPSITCKCKNKPRSVNCINTAADNDTTVAVINNILQSSNYSVSSVHIESPQLYTGARILFPNASLRALDIVNSDLTELHELSLSNLRELKRLDLSNNSLTSIPRSSLRHLSALEQLKLCRNEIQHIYKEDLQNFSKLHSLYLESNKISAIDEGSFATLDMCTTLHLGDNLLSSMNGSIFEGLKNLNTLLISDNRISALPRDLLDHLPNLKKIDARNNLLSLKSIELRSPTLLSLLLQNSSIKEPLKSGTLEGFPMLGVLYLSNNSFVNIFSYSFAHMWNLNKLKLDSCALVSLDDQAFYNLTSLTFLDLSNNFLKKLTCFHTSFLDSLNKITLKYNKLETVEKGTFHYSHSLTDIELIGNKFLCNCELASFTELVRDRAIHLDSSIECTDGSTVDKVDFGKMNCVNNTDICTKVKREAKAVLGTSNNKEFTITIIEITQIDDTLSIKYFINKSSDFSESGYNCNIYHEHIDKGGFQKSDQCFFSIGKEEHINIAISEGKGNYNVCIGILYNETMYFTECKLADYEPLETAEAQSTSDASETIPSSTVSFSTGGSIMPIIANATTTSVATTSPSSIKTIMLITSAATTTSVTTTSISPEKTTMPITSIPKATTAGTFIHETSTVSLAEMYTAKTSKETTELPSHSSEQSLVSTLAGTTTKFPTSFETTMASVNIITTQLPTPSMGPMRPFSALSVKSFFLHYDAKGQLLLSWNVTLEDPQVACYLRFSVLLYSQPEKQWQSECVSGSLPIENASSYHICVEMYLEQKFVEKNCTEFSPIFQESAASSKSTWLSSKLPMAAFIALVILAVIILILIVIVLIKLIYLKRNKGNVYYVAKEEVNNQGEITKRSSKLYSINSVDDDKV